MSVSLLAFLKHAAKFVHVTVARSFSDSSAICYVLLVFVDNVMFSHMDKNQIRRLRLVEFPRWQHQLNAIQRRLVKFFG